MVRRVLSMAVLVFALPLVLPLSGVAAEDDSLKTTLLTTEETLWKAWKDQDAGPFKAHLTENSINITEEGMTLGKAEVIAEITDGSCEVTSFSLTNVKVHRLSDHVALLTYNATQNAVCKGRKLPPEVYASSLYVHQDGKWLAAKYQETPVHK